MIEIVKWLEIWYEGPIGPATSQNIIHIFLAFICLERSRWLSICQRFILGPVFKIYNNFIDFLPKIFARITKKKTLAKIMKILKKTLPFAKINIVRGIVIETLLKFSFADFLFESNSDSVFHWDVFADLCRNFVCKYLLVVLETIKDLKINFKMYLRSSLKYLRSKSFFLLIVHVFRFFLMKLVFLTFLY